MSSSYFSNQTKKWACCAAKNKNQLQRDLARAIIWLGVRGQRERRARKVKATAWTVQKEESKKVQKEDEKQR